MKSKKIQVQKGKYLCDYIYMKCAEWVKCRERKPVVDRVCGERGLEVNADRCGVSSCGEKSVNLPIEKQHLLIYFFLNVSFSCYLKLAFECK